MLCSWKNQLIQLLLYHWSSKRWQFDSKTKRSLCCLLVEVP